jgi:hypothetical protein
MEKRRKRAVGLDNGRKIAENAMMLSPEGDGGERGSGAGAMRSQEILASSAKIFETFSSLLRLYRLN